MSRCCSTSQRRRDHIPENSSVTLLHCWCSTSQRKATSKVELGGLAGMPQDEQWLPGLDSADRQRGHTTASTLFTWSSVTIQKSNLATRNSQQVWFFLAPPSRFISDPPSPQPFQITLVLYNNIPVKLIKLVHHSMNKWTHLMVT